MSQQNVQRTYQLIEAFNRRDLQGYLELGDPGLEFIPYELYLEGGDAYRGHSGVRQWWEDLFAVLPDVRAEIFEIRDFGSRTVVHGRIYGRGAGSGAPIERTMWLVTEWRGDKEVWWGTFGSEEEALEAVSRTELRQVSYHCRNARAAEGLESSGLESLRARFLCEAKVGERPFAFPIGNDLRDLAAANLE